MCTHSAAAISVAKKIKPKKRCSYEDFLKYIVEFLSEPQVNLRNHLPPGDSFFCELEKLEIESDKVLTRAPDGVVNPTSAPGTLILKSTFLSLIFFRS
jgi:hypothetical protein